MRWLSSLTTTVVECAIGGPTHVQNNEQTIAALMLCKNPLSSIRLAQFDWRRKSEKVYTVTMDEGRKRVIGIMAAILASLHMQTADDLFGTPQGSPRTDKLIAASIQWAVQIMRKIDAVCGKVE
jgi:hypothetical protein